SRSADWARAAYSAVGPGRSPGIVKPDLLAFGGDAYRPEYFHVLTEGPRAQLSPELGTSFAAPFLLRSAVGIRAMLGADLSPLAIKALLIHGARNLDHPRSEVGWGKIPEDMMDLITCPDGVARIVYQGELKAGKYLRAPLPLPEGGLSGKVQIKATFCYACPTDPQDSCSYTRAGLEVVFRPNKNNVKAGKSHANSKSFFSKKPYTTEAEARSDLGKWETVLHSKIGTSGIYLDDPVFDIHYNAREAGHSARLATKIRYALIISVEAQKHPDLFNEVLKSYADLVSIRPKVSLPIRV
ncbi:S8 family serine peptidase, partial [Asaia sp. SF2.1]|uniref:S8 family serine peptidase n=1 Tax=Asaia sp. SF2.1 TaxID=406101 RepID=UPI001F3507B1